METIMKKNIEYSFISILITTLLFSCNIPTETTNTIEAPDTPTSIKLPPTVIPMSLDQSPLYWFAPLPPLAVVEGRLFTGSDDYIKLFTPEAPWETAAGQVQVFKLYGEWVGYASESQLKQVVEDTQRRGLALAMEFGPLDPEGCGQGIEGFSGVSYAVDAAKRIKAAGGTLHLLAMDEPYYYAHFYDGPNACHWTPEKIAAEIDQFAKSMKTVFPEILIGDTEALAGPAGEQAYLDWMQTFREVNGYDMAFLHLDIDWSRPNWAQEVKSIVQSGKMTGVPVGIIYTGNAFDENDEKWLSAAGERVKKLELDLGVQPNHILFQSWNDKPDFVLPETAPFTFTNFINTYFIDKSSLGYRREGKGANITLGKSVTVSSQLNDLVGSLAVDGDFGTLWNSGGGPLQWIQIDLGAPANIQEISMTISQYPAGPSTHKILVKSTSGDFSVATTFNGNTNDGDTLVFTPNPPLQNIQFIRIETISSPSWVAWREIEVIDAGN
jgi:hypothetical protein